MNQEQIARNILEEGFAHLYRRKGNLNDGEIEAEVINQACRYIIESYKNIRTTHDINQLGDVIPQNMCYFPIAIAFTNAAGKIFPNRYGEVEINFGRSGIMQNISWGGMWDYLSDYFQKTHGISIDEEEVEPTIFYSTHHDRFQNGVKVSEATVERNINLSFKNGRNDIVVSIEPTLSAKKAYLAEKIENRLIYKGWDPDYVFEVFLNHFDELERFVLELPNRKLKLVYS